MDSQQQTNKVTKNDIFKWSLTRILLTTQQYIQDISNDWRETDCKQSFVCLLFW